MIDVSFIDERDHVSFGQHKRRFPRLIRELRSDGKSTKPEDLEDTVVDLAKQIDGEFLRGFHCVSISVDEGHGMTWAAEAARRAIAESAPRMKLHSLVGELDAPHFPGIGQLVGWRRVARYAQRCKLYEGNRLLRWPLAAIIFVGAVVMSAVVIALTPMLKGVTAADFGVQMVPVALIIGVAVIGGKLLGDLVPKPDLSGKTRAALAEALRSEGVQGTRSYRQLVDDLAVYLAELSANRAIVVDDFTRLDKLTRDVLEAYLELANLDESKQRNPELWILFSRSDYKRLTKAALDAHRDQPFGLQRTRVFFMENLTQAQRNEIAQLVGKPERSSFNAVRAITRTWDELTDLASFVDAFHSDRRQPAGERRHADVLDLCYLLALGAAAGRNPWLREREVVSRFSQETELRTRLLKVMLPRRRITKDTLRALLQEIKIEFPILVEVDGTGESRSLRARAEVGYLLSERFRKLDLPAPGVGHLFWALYWSDTQRENLHDIEWLGEVTAHLLKSSSPVEIADMTRWSDDALRLLNQTLFDLHLAIVRQSLAICVLKDLPRLLERAKGLTETDDDLLNRRLRRRLRTVMWEAYSLLGDDSILSMVLDMEEPSADRPAAHSDAALSLTDLFIESLPRLDLEVSGRYDRFLSQIVGDPTLATLASTRGAWVAAALRPFLGKTLPRLKEVVEEASPFFVETMRDSVNAAVESNQDEITTIQYASASLGAWTLGVLSVPRRSANTMEDTLLNLLTVIRTDRSHVLECLESAFLLGLDLAERRRQSDDRKQLNLVLDTLAQELLISVLAAAVVIAAQPNPLDRGLSIKDLDDLIRECTTALDLPGIDVDALSEQSECARITHMVEKYMVLLQVAWRGLGFDHLGAMMSVRQAQFVAALQESDELTSAHVLDIVSADFGVYGHIAIIAQLIGAEAASVSTNMQAQLVLRAAMGAVDGELGGNLARELCLLSVQLGHSYELQLRPPMEYLTGAGKDGRSRLDRVLQDLTDDTFARMCLPLLNALKSDDLADLRPSLLESMKARAANVSAKETHDKIAQQFAIFEMQTRLSSGKVAIDEELNRWDPWKGASGYEFVLYLLLRRREGKSSDRLYGEAIRVLEAGGDYTNTTGFVFLAAEVLLDKRSHSRTDLTSAGLIAVAALRTAMERWERTLSPRMNLKAFRLLSQLDREFGSDYSRQLRKWREIDLQAYGVEQLPHLVVDGRFFLILWYYYTIFSPEGLVADPHVSPFGLTSDEIERELIAWRRAPHVIPDCMSKGASGRCLSGAFLSLGYALFNLGEDQYRTISGQAGDLRDARSKLHRNASACMPEIYRSIRALPSVPIAISHILERHQAVTQRASELT